MTEPIPVDPATLVTPADDLQVVDGHRLLIGGSPLSILRLSAAGATRVRHWFAGQPVGSGREVQSLARRLQRIGMARLDPPPPSTRPPSTVVIPVKDDRPGLEQTLADLGPPSTDRRILVVDDGSAQPVTGLPPGVEVLTRPRAGGPGVARAHAMVHLDTEVVVFVDAGVSVTAGVVDSLIDSLADPAVVAVAPRIRSRPDPHVAGRYDRYRSPLDLGPSPSVVGPGRAVPYVPTACLAVRSSAMAAVGGFDPELRYGEDVDLVWRLQRRGLVSYAATLEAEHGARESVLALARQRFHYGSSAAALADRHGREALSPCRVSPWSIPVLGLLGAGHPVSALAVAAATGLALRPQLEPMPDLTVRALGLVARGHWYAGWSVATALVRAWGPATVVALAVAPPLRRRLGPAVVAGVCRRLLDGPRQPTAAAIDLGVGIVDDLAYGAGLWWGAVRARSPRSLLPMVTRWSPEGPGRRPDAAPADPEGPRS